MTALPEFSLPAAWQLGNAEPAYYATLTSGDLSRDWLVVAVLPSSHTPI